MIKFFSCLLCKSHLPKRTETYWLASFQLTVSISAVFLILRKEYLKANSPKKKKIEEL